MVYPSEFEIKLGFDQIRERLLDYCISTPGRFEVGNIHCRSDYNGISDLLHQVREFKSIRERTIPFPLSQYFDPSPHYNVIAVENSFIEAESLREVGISLQVIEDCVKFLHKAKEDYPKLHQLTQAVSIPIHIIDSINSKIDDTNQLKDNASAELNRIRKNLKNEEHRARKLIDHMFKEAVANGIVPEGSSPVIREGRVVIPVLSEYKRKIKGVIMDESATGQTIYMEPTEVIEANNEIRNLELEERRECIKILRSLTSLLREHLPAIKAGFKFIGQLDFIQAKTKLAFELDADLPNLIDKPMLDWVNAKHPLLFISHKDKNPIVPLTIDLTSEERFLLVSGPNAGGKSVCLKTVGLIQYMMQCGLLVPMDTKSRVGIFNHIYLDIGDQQSIENDLSTYSSHLRNMRYFIDNADDNTLVLMDELGAGTDPNFGGGIAEAIIKTLVGNKVWGVATTHYYNLKLYADNNDGIRNAAMQFDSKKLEPLFLLNIGKPGSSFALEIAKKIGLTRNIISHAENLIGKDLTGLESLIKKVNDERQNLEKREQSVKSKEIKFNELLNKYNQLAADLELKKKEIINKAKEEAALLLKQTNKEIEKTIRHIKENRAEKKETKRVRQTLQGLKQNVEINEEESQLDKNIVDGDYVKIPGQDVAGKIVSIKGNTALVQFGDMRSSIKIDKLIKSIAGDAKPSKSSARSLGVDLISKQTNFNPTLDVRGLRVEEINSVLDQFLDDAVLLGHGSLRILHGKGEGVLRKVVRERLKMNTNVETFGDEHIDRGGAGITTVVIK